MSPFRQKRTLLQKASEYLLDPSARIHDPELCLFLCDAIQKANDCLKVPMPDSVVVSLKKELKGAMKAFTGSVLTSGTVGNVLRTTTLSDAVIEQYEIAYRTRLGLIRTYTEQGFNIKAAIDQALVTLNTDLTTKKSLSGRLRQGVKK